MKLAYKIAILFIKEAFICLAMKVTSVVSSFFETYANQAAGTLEIQRLRHDIDLAFSEFVINNQQNLHLICLFLLILLSIMAILIFIKDAIKIKNFIDDEENSIKGDKK